MKLSMGMNPNDDQMDDLASIKCQQNFRQLMHNSIETTRLL